jgi:peptidoglycan glycosyltransferase
VTLNRQLRILTLALIACFAGIALSAAYWASLERDRLLARQDNPRLLEARASIQRGSIFDRKGELLVESQSQQNDARPPLIRSYASPAFYGALGYFSLTYGTGGIENDYDRILSGADRSRTLEQILFNAPIIGSDILTTFDRELQETLYDAFADYRGAAIVMSVPDGDILALLSHPAFDPNTLDQDWATLLQDPGNPFFNRAIQGRYQPGGVAQMPLLALFDLANASLETPLPAASAPVRLETALLTCMTRPPRSQLTLTEAFIYGCPAPFLMTEDMFEREQITRALQQLNRGSTQSSLPTVINDSAPLRDTLLGQGQQVVSPLDVTLFIAAVINEGNAPPPRTLLATSPPSSEAWSTFTPDLPTIPIMTSEAADHLRSLLIVAESIRGAQWEPDVAVGAHLARAYTGEGTLVWFAGYADFPSDGGVVVTIVIEGTRDSEVARGIGVRALHAAISATRP